MAYEAEKNRLAALLTDVVGITRQRDSDLEREATERAFEARQQTGLNSGSADGDDLIVHPDAATRRSRLGVPSDVGTAEIATWNYLYNDPVNAAANGFLSSIPHRAVLDSSVYTHWGIGVYSEMPKNPTTGLPETNELFRRWWFIVWFATKAIGTAALATPTDVFPAKKISFTAGTHWGYKFGYDGRIISTKSITLTASSSASVTGRGKIPNRTGTFLLVSTGGLAGYWVEEDGFYTYVHPKLT